MLSRNIVLYTAFLISVLFTTQTLADEPIAWYNSLEGSLVEDLPDFNNFMALPEYKQGTVVLYVFF